MCSVKEEDRDIGFNCAFGVAYNQLIPYSWTGQLDIWFYKSYNAFLSGDYFGKCEMTDEQSSFVTVFDKLRSTPEKRYSLVGQEFEIEIPDEVIEYWYGDSVKAAQKIIDNPILKVLNPQS